MLLDGSNECPAGWMRIETMAACQSFVQRRGPFISLYDANTPRGCYYGEFPYGFFNSHPVGAGKSGYQLVCPVYMWAVAGSNECPAGSVRIETNSACSEAGYDIGIPTEMSWTSPDMPRGCFYYINNKVMWFNDHAVGTGNSGHQLLCAAVTTGAPLPRRCAHPPVCAPTRVCVACALARRSCVRLWRCGSAAAGRVHLCGLCGVAASAGRCMGAGSMCVYYRWPIIYIYI